MNVKKDFNYIITVLFFLVLLSCNNKEKMFTQLAVSETGISFTNKINDTDSFNIITYPYAFNGAGVGIADFNKDGLEDIFFSGNHKATNKLYINNGNFKFSDVTDQAGVQGKSDWCTGVAVVDMNYDTWPDIYVSTVSIPGMLKSTNELYINNQNGTFTEAAAQYGLDTKAHTTQTAFFDYDLDGDLDCYMLNHSVNYVDDYKTAEIRLKHDSLSGDKLLRNDNGKFKEVTTAAGIYSSVIGFGLGVSIADVNNDGWPDIYISNDFKENDYCYINNGFSPSPEGEGRGEVTFSEKSNQLFQHMTRYSMGNDIADYNNDGMPDVMTLDMLSQDEKVLKASVSDDDMGVYEYKHKLGFHYQYSKNCLQQNADGLHFSDVAYQSGVAATDWSWAPLLADFDNDGNKDLFISNGYKYRLNNLDFISFLQTSASKNKQEGKPVNLKELSHAAPNGSVADYFYINQKEKGFADMSVQAGFTKPTLSNGAAYADLDNDGNLDLVVNRMDESAGIYKNNMPAKNFLQLQLKGAAGNTSGIGAVAYVFTKGEMQMLYQSPVRGFMSSVSPRLHIGLGDEKIIDSVIVVWPGGKGQRITNITSNQLLILDEKKAVINIVRPELNKRISAEWVNTSSASGINFQHREDGFNDLNVQPFLPHSLATLGPALATGDVNGDGLEDVYIGGAKNQAGALYLQNNQSVFSYSAQTEIAKDSLCEDTDAVFFDADNDNDLDLYVTSGGNEVYGRNDLLLDRLYINDGKGNFTRQKDFPALYENKSCVRVCDFDKDSDNDLFVGGRANARMYGFVPASVILQNDGKGNFTEVTEKIAIGLINVGMVSDAVWTDIDKDGWMDLLLAGEWMPVTVFKNEKGKLIKQRRSELALSNGMWNCVYAADLDKDGDDDYLLGNWGTNSKLKASADHPLCMYIADWNKNAETDPVMAVYKNNTYYPFFGKADLEKRLPYLKKTYLKYDEAAGKTLDELFGKEEIKKAKRTEAFTLQSSVLWNSDGKLELEPLPEFLQAAPLFSFSSFTSTDGTVNYLAAGNFYEVSPFEGRYDAMLPTAFHFEKKKAVFGEYILEKGCIRKMNPLKLVSGQTGFLFAKNNEALALVSKKINNYE
jgi:enediyne biosynthesis protein E4